MRPGVKALKSAAGPLPLSTSPYQPSKISSIPSKSGDAAERISTKRGSSGAGQRRCFAETRLVPRLATMAAVKRECLEKWNMVVSVELLSLYCSFWKLLIL